MMCPRSSKSGFALIGVLVASILVVGAVTYVVHYNVTRYRTLRSQEQLARSDFTAESLARIMADRLIAAASWNLGVIDSALIARLNDEIPSLPVPPGITIDLDNTTYAIGSVVDGEYIPYDQEPLRVVTDHPRKSFDVLPDFAGVQTTRTYEVVIVATVEDDRMGKRTALTRLSVAKVLPFQRAINTAGDLEVCVSPGSRLLIQGRVHAHGNILSQCGGARTFTGEIVAQNDVLVDGSAGTHEIQTPNGTLPLMTLTRKDATADASGVIQAYGGRVKIRPALGGSLIAATFQDAVVAGSGECPDFDGACGGRSQYNPSIVIQKRGNATTDLTDLDITCGAAYARMGDPNACKAQILSAVTYVTYPFSVAPSGTARTVPSTGVYWQGLFPDPRRENRCTATVNDEQVKTYRCDTNAYGYVIDVSRLARVEGGLLTIRKTQNGASTFNPSGYQEVVVIKNARTLYGPLTIHTDLPVYIAGDFNSYAPQPAMIDAPMITLLPADFEQQVKQVGVWDSTALVSPRPLRATQPVRINAILRSRYQLSEANDYFGGTVEAIPHVLGDWSAVGVEVIGAIEGRPWGASEIGAYRSAHKSYGVQQVAQAVKQPAYRVIEFNPALRDPQWQPPGSWHPKNMPLNSSGNPERTAERQVNAAGGHTIIRLVQEPTRLPTHQAMTIAVPPLTCEDSEGKACAPEDATPPHLGPSALSCTPNPVPHGQPVACQITATVGTYPLLDFTFDWDDGTVQSVVATGNTGSATHLYQIPGEYTLRARAHDIRGYASGDVTYLIKVEAQPPMITATCSPAQVTPRSAYDPGEPVSCTITVLKQSYPIAAHYFNWGDGNSTARTSPNGVETETYAYQSEGTFTIELFVRDRGGLESNRVTATVEARWIPPTISTFACAPNPVEPGAMVECTITVQPGSGVPLNEVTLDWGDGATSTASIASGQATVQHAYHTGSETAADDRSYTIVATATDRVGKTSAPAAFVVSVRTRMPQVSSLSCNPPAVYTGDQIVCTLGGTKGTFPVASYHFDWGDGTPVEQVNGGEGMQNRSHVYSLPGGYLVRGWVTDDRGNMSDVRTYRVEVASTTQLGANLTCTPTNIYTGQTVNCTIKAIKGAGTLNPKEYEFRWGDGQVTSITNPGDQVSASRTFNTAGLYDVCGVVIDTRGVASPPSCVTVSVSNPPPSTPPTVTVVCDPTYSPTGSLMTSCTATAVRGSGAIAAYEWGCDSSSTTTQTSSSDLVHIFTCSYSSEGTFSPRVRVRASDNLWSTWASASVVVENAVPPGTVANITCPSSVYAGDPFECTAGVYGATPVRYRFTWGDGSPEVVVPSSASSVAASYTYVAGTRGTRTARVYVDLPGGKSIPASAQIDVQAAPVPTVSCEATPRYAKPGSGVTLTVNYDGRGSLVRTVSYTVYNPRGGAQANSWTVNEWVGSRSTSNIDDSQKGIYPVSVVAANGEVSGMGPCQFERESIEPARLDCTLTSSVYLNSGTGNYHCVASHSNPETLVQMTVQFIGPDGSVVEDSSCKGKSGQASVTCTNRQPDSREGQWTLRVTTIASYASLSEQYTEDHTYQVTGLPPNAVITYSSTTSGNPGYPHYVGVVNGITTFDSRNSSAQGGATIVSRTWTWAPGKAFAFGCDQWGACQSSDVTITPVFDDQCDPPRDYTYPLQPDDWGMGYVSLTVVDSRGASATSTVRVEYPICTPSPWGD